MNLKLQLHSSSIDLYDEDHSLTQSNKKLKLPIKPKKHESSVIIPSNELRIDDFHSKSTLDYN